MLVPAPRPAYTLSPDLEPLTDGQLSALNTCLDALTGRLVGVVVTGASSSGSHHIVELLTSAGTLLAMERVSAVPERLAAA